MINWVMDPDIYGMPDYGVNVNVGRTFTPSMGDIGPTRYVPYNPTGPIPASLTYGWSGNQLAQFREAWETWKGLNYGNSWFEITIPVYIARGQRRTEVYDAHITQPPQATLAGLDYWKVVLSLDLDASKRMVSDG